VRQKEKKTVLLFSTLQPYPFWAGSENFWFDFVSDERVNSLFQFHLRLADSPVTRAKAEALAPAGAEVSFYKHFNVNFGRRNIYRLSDRIKGRGARTLPWYDAIKSGPWDLVWFCVDGLHSMLDLEYATGICRETGIPYWLALQHGYEDFFLTTGRDIEAVSSIATDARRFVFIADRNRQSLERAIGKRLENAFSSVNALQPAKIAEAGRVSKQSPPGSNGTAHFFSLGRFSPKDKGQHLLLEALADREWKERAWELSFIGIDDFGKEYLERLIGFFGIEKSKIRIVSHTKDVFAEIARHDVLLMPSLAEGTPFAMIESMACGRPAIGTPIGGIPELIRDGETGWLARTTDIADIAQALERAWTDRERWAAMGCAARQNVEANYNEEKSFGELLEVLKNDTGYELGF
jgi:glycosyltransferase involved in cell wall biosynthesis